MSDGQEGTRQIVESKLVPEVIKHIRGRTQEGLSTTLLLKYGPANQILARGLTNRTDFLELGVPIIWTNQKRYERPKTIYEVDADRYVELELRNQKRRRAS